MHWIRAKTYNNKTAVCNNCKQRPVFCAIFFFCPAGVVLPKHCRAAMGGGDLLHYIQAKDMRRIFGRLRSVQCRQNGSG